MVTVTSATSTKPTVFPLIQCGSGTGSTITLGCLATGFTPSSLTYTWTKNGAALTDFIQYPTVQKDNFYQGVSQIQVSRQDWDAEHEFNCAATHAAGLVEKGFKKPVVIYKEPTVKLFASSNDESEAYFSCFANDFSPNQYEIKWLLNDQKLTNQIHEVKTLTAERKDEKGNPLYSAASFVMLNSSDLSSDSDVMCQFEGKKHQIVNSTHHQKPINPTEPDTGCPEADVDIQLIGPSIQNMVLNRQGMVYCQVRINKINLEKISWETENGKSINDAEQITKFDGPNKIYKAQLPITFDEWSRGDKFVCKVEHNDWMTPLKRTYQRINGGTTQRPSVFMLPPLEHSKKETVTLSCFVKDFYPHEVFVSWLVDDEEADFPFSTTTPVENNGSFSAYGQLTISSDHWKNNDTVYSCVVYHESLVDTAIRSIVRSIGHRTSENTNMVNLNMNIPDTCKAQ
ncbi:hypothetical protein PBY51_008049 [Eleginops maclovinus]|uniref:Ig-like domain-containing protein n=1 Tax=Eleginops maclovinus TaxID=56733 RepID=A0AAN7X2M1_ELEMC|nr:hypothetical protein PBY51_008049 [Eleginops maclovinus]